MNKTAGVIFSLLLAFALLTGCQTKESGSSSEPEPNEPQSYTAGDTVSFKRHEITVTGWEWMEKVPITPHAAVSAGEGMEFIVFHITVTNTGESKDIPFRSQPTTNDILATVQSGDESYYFTWLKGYDPDLCGLSLEAGETVEGILAYPMPSEAIEAERLILSIAKGSKEYIFELN